MAVLYQSVSHPYPSVSTSLSLLSLLSRAVENGNRHSGCGHFFFQFDILNVWTWSEEDTLASLAILPVCILSPSSFRCIVPAHFLQATAFQHCKPVRAAHCKLVVPIENMWCPLQSCGAHCKLVVPIANLWSQFGAHCKRPIVQQESVRPGLRQNWNLMRYIWTCTSTYRPHRGFNWYRGKPIEQDWHARLTFFIHTQLNLKELGDKNKMIQLMLIGGQADPVSMYSARLGKKMLDQMALGA